MREIFFEENSERLGEARRNSGGVRAARAEIGCERWEWWEWWGQKWDFWGRNLEGGIVRAVGAVGAVGVVGVVGGTRRNSEGLGEVGGTRRGE